MQYSSTPDLTTWRRGFDPMTRQIDGGVSIQPFGVLGRARKGRVAGAIAPRLLHLWLAALRRPTPTPDNDDERKKGQNTNRAPAIPSELFDTAFPPQTKEDLDASPSRVTC